ncbi:MAG: dethiobiotin synthase [Flavobacteriaceae bacterium]
MNRSIFVCGIGTDVGKTVVSAILVKALKADYFKPIQAGDLEFSDTDRVRDWVGESESRYFENSYALTAPMSPHAAAKIDQVHINLTEIKRPSTTNTLIVEAAGGLMVPLNDCDVVADLIQAEDEVVLVSRNYLGSINHTLLSVYYLQSKGVEIKGIVFNGPSNAETEHIILEKTGCECLGRIAEEKEINQEIIAKYASKFEL